MMNAVAVLFCDQLRVNESEVVKEIEHRFLTRFCFAVIVPLLIR